MRVLIVLSLIAIVFGSRVCEAGMSATPPEVSAPTASAAHHRGRGHVHHAGRVGGPIAAIGGAIGGTIGGLFRR